MVIDSYRLCAVYTNKTIFGLKVN